MSYEETPALFYSRVELSVVWSVRCSLRRVALGIWLTEIGETDYKSLLGISLYTRLRREAPALCDVNKDTTTLGIIELLSNWFSSRMVESHLYLVR